MKKTLWLTILFALVLALPATAQNTAVYIEQGGAKLVVGSGGTLELADGSTLTGAETLTWTLGADEYFRIDASSTAQTQTGGALDINFASITAAAAALNIAAVVNNGTTASNNIYAGYITMTCNDADADCDGIAISAAATTNAAAGSYEFGLAYDCAENTTAACTDGVIITSSGASSSVTDGVDVSDSDIVNAINIGTNLVMGGNSDTLSVGATDATLIVDRNDAGSVTFSCTDDDANATCIYDSGGTGAIEIGSADTEKITLTAKDDLTLGLTSGSAGEDILITQSGANDSSIVLTAAGTGTDAIALQATAGTIDVDGNYVNIDSTEDMHFQVTSSQAGEDLYIAQVGGNDSSVLISAAGTGSDAVQLMASAGSVDIQASLDVTVTPGDDLDLWGDEGAVAAAGNVDSYRCMGGFCQTVMTLTDVAVNIANTSGPGHNCFGGVKIYDFPAGWINRLGVVATFTSITFGVGGLADNSDGDVSFGSTTAVEDGGLAGTEADWVPTTELTTAAGGIVPAELATSTVTEQTFCDGSSAACDLYMNFEFDDADCSALDTLAVVGTVTVTWLDLGDN